MIPRIVIGLIAASLLAVSATGRSQIVGDLLPLTNSSGERCFEDEICPSPWIQYEWTDPWSNPETHDAWSCQSRSRWCWTMAGGEGCSCSGTQPPGTWIRVDDRSDVSVVPDPWAAPLLPVTDLSPGDRCPVAPRRRCGNEPTARRCTQRRVEAGRGLSPVRSRGVHHRERIEIWRDDKDLCDLETSSGNGHCQQLALGRNAWH